MSQAGGPATQTGIHFQNSIAALYLGQLCDTREMNAFLRVEEVRVESPTHVDDIVVTFHDGHHRWIQAKTRLNSSGKAWKKMWSDFERQRWSPEFKEQDELVLVVEQPSALCSDLQELSIRARGARDENEWWRALSNPMLKTIERVESSLSSPCQKRDILLALFSRLFVEVESLERIENGSARPEIPQSSVDARILFRLLRDKAAARARNRKIFRRVELVRELREKDGISIADLAHNHQPQPIQRTRNIPHLRNPYFTGREQVLEQLREVLCSAGSTTLTPALTGLGGVGKTQVAIEYSYRYWAHYRLIWWIRAEGAESLSFDYSRLAEVLNLPALQSGSREQVELIREWLEQNPGWLLVFDNAEEPAALTHYLPRVSRGHVLITSRNPNWAAIGRPLPITRFRREEAIAFLQKRTADTDSMAASALAEVLGDLPLALAQAAAYAEQTGSTLTQYHALFLSQQADLLRNSPTPLGYPESVWTTWEISFAQVRKICPPAADLLSLCAFFAPEEIPQRTIQRADDYVPSSLLVPCNNPLEFDKVIGALRKYSLIASRDGSFSIHRLVQATTRHRMTPEKQREFAALAVRVVHLSFWLPSTDPRERESLVPHAFAVVEHAQQLGAQEQQAVRLLNSLGVFLGELGDYINAKRAHSWAVRLVGSVHQGETMEGACMANLGVVLIELGELTEARRNLERSLVIFKKTKGRKHVDVLSVMSSLARVRLRQRAPRAALKLCQTALSIGEEILPPADAQMAVLLNVTGVVLMDIRDYPGARQHLERALEIAEVREDQTSAAAYINNLGGLADKEGDLTKAWACYERALQIDEEYRGLKHPLIALRLTNLASLSREQGRFEQARKYYERAIAILEEVFPDGHPDIVSAKIRLLDVLSELGEAQAIATLMKQLNSST